LGAVWVKKKEGEHILKRGERKDEEKRGGSLMGEKIFPGGKRTEWKGAQNMHCVKGEEARNGGEGELTSPY